ncbi:YVTN family repeat [compost metagenome]
MTTGKGAHGVAISTDGAYVFVSNIEAGTVSVIDTHSRKVVGTHKVGAGPNGISFKPSSAQ